MRLYGPRSGRWAKAPDRDWSETGTCPASARMADGMSKPPIGRRLGWPNGARYGLHQAERGIALAGPQEALQRVSRSGLPRPRSGLKPRPWRPLPATYGRSAPRQARWGSGRAAQRRAIA